MWKEMTTGRRSVSYRKRQIFSLIEDIQNLFKEAIANFMGSPEAELNEDLGLQQTRLLGQDHVQQL